MESHLGDGRWWVPVRGVRMGSFLLSAAVGSRAHYTVCVVSAALGLSNARQAEQPRLVLGGGDDGVACRVQLRRRHPRTLRVLLLSSTGITRRNHRPPSPHAHSRGEWSHYVLGLHKCESSTTFRSLPQSSIVQVITNFRLKEKG